MRRPALLKIMVDQMIVHQAKPEQIRQFHNHWARLSARQPTPCPICYLAEKERTLHQRQPDSDMDRFICITCQSIFEVRQIPIK